MHSPPPRTSRFIPVTVSYIALETSKNVMARGASRERSPNVNESESESVGCSERKQMAHSDADDQGRHYLQKGG